MDVKTLTPTIGKKLEALNGLGRRNDLITNGCGDTVDALYQFIELSTLLEAIYMRLNNRYYIDGLEFQIPGWSRSYGNIKNCSSTLRGEFRVQYGANILGLVKVYRQIDFEPSEIASITDAINDMGGPISNALAHKRACHSAYHDAVTGLDNRAALDVFFLAKNKRRPTVLMVCDIDRFKMINDTYGHAVGDEVLRLFAVRLQTVLTGTGTVFRYGGDEFVIALNGVSLEDGRQIAEKIWFSIESRKFKVGEICIDLTTTIGITKVGVEERIEKAFVRADSALISGKKCGGNRVVDAAAFRWFPSKPMLG